VLQSVQVLTAPSNIGSLHTPCSAIGTPLEHGLEAFLELDADRVVETSKWMCARSTQQIWRYVAG
jgi:hypothetical protein